MKFAYLKKALLVSAAMLISAPALASELCYPAESGVLAPSQFRGASLFEQYCALCHGKRSNGKGRAARLHTPPPANLRDTVMPNAYLEQIIRVGGEKLDRGIGMPPWEDELSDSQISDLISYIDKVRQLEKLRKKECPESIASGSELDKKDTRKDKFHPADLLAEPSKFRGATVFENHCVFCHGVSGDGESRSAAFLKPKPANLTTSTLSKEEVANAVKGGGKAIGKSEVMPAWGGSLTEEQINDVVDFVMSIRTAGDK